MEQLKYFSYEARALRAFYIFELAKRYGDIAMPTHVLTTDEANSIGKTTFEDAVGFIASECDECASVLPASYENQPYKELGRVTKGFAMALKTKALLYAASPLHNPKNDKELWKKAARAVPTLVRQAAAKPIPWLSWLVSLPNAAAIFLPSVPLQSS